MPEIDIATVVLILANVLISYKGFRDPDFFRRNMFNIHAIRVGRQYGRTLTSGFLHADGAHLLFNMVTLYFFADSVIWGFGQANFILLYFVSLWVGSAFAVYFHRDEPGYNAVGASGAVTGILYAAILLRPDVPLYFIFLPMVGIPGYLLGIGYLLYSIYGMKARNDNIGHTAHFGGAVGGYLGALYLDPSIIEKETMVVVLMALPIVLLFVLFRSGRL